MAFNGSTSSDANYEAARLAKEVAHADALTRPDNTPIEPELHEASLGAAFAAVPGELGLRPAVGYRVVVEGRQRELKRSLRGEVYRIVQEAIVNAHRHSGAKEIETEIAYGPTELRIAVRDNGCGIDPHGPQWRRNGHWGLQRMREQADRIGARLRVWSRTPFGTHVELRVPGRIAFEHSGSACG